MCKTWERRRDDDRVPKNTRSKSMQHNLKGHLYERSMIPRGSQQVEKPNKGSIIRGNHRSERRNYRGQTKHQEGMEKSGG
jgi:hypothetical protein